MRRFRRWLLVPAVLVYVGALAAPGLAPRLYRIAQPLDPFLTVLTDLDHEAAAAALRAAGVPSVVTPASTYVHVSRFRSVEQVPLTRALESLDPRDPRRDPWIEGLGRYFVPGGRNAIYARIDRPVHRAQRLVRRALDGAGTVAEYDVGRIAASLAVYAVVALAVMIVSGSSRWRIAPAIPPLVPVIVVIGPEAAVAASAVLVYVGWAASEASRLLRLRAHSRVSGSALIHPSMPGLATAVILSCVYLVRIAGWSSLAPFSIGLAGALVGAAAGLVLVRQLFDADHRPFLPVSLLPGRFGPVVRPVWTRMSLLLAPMLFLLPPLFDAWAPGTELRPVPTGSTAPTAPGFSYESLHDVWVGRSAEDLPDLSDYVAHRAHQQGLVYGRTYAFPQLDEAIILQRVREEPDGAYATFAQPVLRFDAEWFERAIADTSPGLASLLAGIGRPTGVVLATGDAVYSGYSRLLHHFIFVALVLSPFLLAAIPWARNLRARGSITELSRRRRQVA